MRLTLWILLVTLVVLLSSADAIPTTTTGVTRSKLAPLDSTNHATNGKRLLRSNPNKSNALGDNPSLKQPAVDEERGISTSFARLKSMMATKLGDFWGRILNRIYMWMYNKQIKPEDIDPMKHPLLFELYTAWYNVKVTLPK
uniref:RxLR effector protein n=1 Tax=Phytophthora agathidicida TaxID=1642459 RepID=A0A7G4WI12_9STRA|nr:PaRXLR23 [Phytophthora agathidicida]